MRRGIAGLSRSKKKEKLEDWFENELIPRFEKRIIPIDEKVALEWGDTLINSEKAGRSLPSIDAFLAATAKTHDLTLVTRNIKDFQNLPIKIFDPFIGSTD